MSALKQERLIIILTVRSKYTKHKFAVKEIISDGNEYAALSVR